MTTSALGLNLRNAREAKGWSRVTLSAKSGVSTTTIALFFFYWESPVIYTLAAISKALGLALADLMDIAA